jgi:hypothetical protein
MSSCFRSQNPFLKTNGNGNYDRTNVSNALKAAQGLERAETNSENRRQAYLVVEAAARLAAAQAEAPKDKLSSSMASDINDLTKLAKTLGKRYDVRVATFGEKLLRAAAVALPVAFAVACAANERGAVPHTYFAPTPANSTLSSAFNATSSLARSSVVQAAEYSFGCLRSTLGITAVLMAGACGIAALAKRCFSK